MDHEKWLEQHDRRIADHEMRHDREMAELRASQAKTEKTLRQAIRLSVLDGRRQRKRNAEFAEQDAQLKQQDAQFKQSMAELSAALKAFLERGSNGKH